MFYLLENNRIIDMNNICSQKEFIEENGKLKELTGFNLSSMGLQKFYNDVYVKKQSENVFDLIEDGDLVKYERYDDEFYIEEVIDLISTGIFVEVETPTEYVRDEKVLAIYKPDENGNYIKAWEKKDGR